MNEPRPRLILADDHRLLVQGLRQMLGRRFDVVGVAYDGEALLDLLRTTTADCLLLDLSLPGRSGLEILPEIRALQPALRILVLTMHVDRILAEASLASGALGFVPKDSGMEELETALTEVLAGRRFLSPRVPKTSHRMGLDAAHLSLSRLTPRQQEILSLLGQGKSSEEIAHHIGLTTSAITWHRAHIRKALGLTSEWELARFAILVNLATTGPEAAEPPH
jgi:DNA-binding NarL/FixJ family response regulator